MELSHEVTSWVFWMFKSWGYGYFEYLWGDVISILNNEVTLWKYSEADVMGILKFIFKIITRLLKNIQNTRDLTSRIFKIPMSLWIFKIQNMCHIFKITTSFEYSKYPWHHFKNIKITNDVNMWIFKMPHE